MQYPNKAKLLIVPGVIIGSIAGLALSSMALDTEQDTDPRVFVYNGVLDFQQERFTGQVDMHFAVSDDLDNPGCSLDEAHESVQVFNGQFQVNIGSQTQDGVPDCIFDGTAMFIQIGVRGANDEGDFEALDGAQRIYPTAAAYWMAEGHTLNAAGITVGQTLNVQNLNINSGGVDVRGTATSTGPLRVSNQLVITGSATLGDSPDDTIDLPSRTLNANAGMRIDSDATMDQPITLGGTLVASHINNADIGDGLVRTSSDLNAGFLTASTVTTGALSTGGDFEFGSVTNPRDMIAGATNDTTVFNGAINFTTCRLCLLSSDSNNSSKGYACINMADGRARNHNLAGDVDGNDRFGLYWDCDNGNTASRNVASNVSWPSD